MGSAGPNPPNRNDPTGGIGLHRGAPAASPGKAGDRVIPFGKYLLLDRIAVGGMAEVYTAKSFGVEGFEKIIAVKRILPTMAEDDDFIQMFIDEAKIAGHLNHANVAPIYELGKIGESHYIALEYVWGKDLLQIMNRFRKMRRHMPPSMAAWIASKMCEGLDYAHRKKDRNGRPLNIIHRDVSPQNCLVSYEGQVKMIDFGIAKAAARNTKTQAGVLKGKFGYMSPEQVRGNAVDYRSDVFAVGTCMYEMLTTERLFVGESDFSTLEKVRHAAVPPLSQAVPDVPKELEDIVMKALAAEVEDRWQSAGEMQEALSRFIARERPPFGTSKLSAWMKTAFAAEITKEKARLDSFAKVGPPPSTPPRPPPPKNDDEPTELAGEATMITASPFEAMEAGAASADDLMGQPTQIFFSADEADDNATGVAPGAASPVLAVAAPRPVGTPQAPPPPNRSQTLGMGSGRAMPPPPALSPTAPEAYAPTVVPPEPQHGPPGYGQGYPGAPMPGAPMPGGAMQGMPMHGQPTQGAPMQGSPGAYGAPPPQYGGPGPTGGFAAAPPAFSPSRGQATIEVQAPPGPPTQKRRGGLVVFAVLGAAAVIALAVGGALLLSGPAVGTIEIHTVPEAAAADVILDGTPRGRAPLRLDHVSAGEHVLLVQAAGYAPITRNVTVAANGSAMIDLLLTPSGAAIAAAPAAVPLASAPVAAMPAPTAAAPIAAVPIAAAPIAPGTIDPASGLPVGTPPAAPVVAPPAPAVAVAAVAPVAPLPAPATGPTTAPAPAAGTATAGAAAPAPAVASGSASSGSSGSSGSASTSSGGGSGRRTTGSGSSGAGSSGSASGSASSGSTTGSTGSTGRSGPVHLAPGTGRGGTGSSGGSAGSGSTGPSVRLPGRETGTGSSGSSSGGSGGSSASGSSESGSSGSSSSGGGSTRGRGTLVIQTLPWARVFLDGRDTGRNTPVRSLEVSAGTHRLGLRTHDGTMHEETITVTADETLRIVRQF